MRRRWPCRAAATLGVAIAAFFIGQAALGVAVERWLPGVRDPEFALKLERLRERLAEDPDRPLVLALGSSRTMLGLDAGRLHLNVSGRRALVFNFGLSGGGPIVEALALRRLREAGIRPDVLLVEVLPPALNRPGAAPVEEEWLDAARLSWDELTFLNRYFSDRQRAKKQWLKGRAAPCLRHGHGLRCELALDSADPATRPERCLYRVDEHGWSPYPRAEVAAEERRALSAAAVSQYECAWGSFRLAEGPAAALRDVVAAAREDGIPVGLYLMPEAASFRALYSDSFRDGVEDFVNAVAQQTVLPTVDARDWLDDDAFSDGHHPLRGGAVAFTERFEGELKIPLRGPRK